MTSNRIIEVRLYLANETEWIVQVTKEFAPENGGGTQTFTEPGGHQIHRALDVARGMVTVSPAQRTTQCLECGQPFRGGLYCDACTAKHREAQEPDSCPVCGTPAKGGHAQCGCLWKGL